MVTERGPTVPAFGVNRRGGVNCRGGVSRDHVKSPRRRPTAGAASNPPSPSRDERSMSPQRAGRAPAFSNPMFKLEHYFACDTGLRARRSVATARD